MGEIIRLGEDPQLISQANKLISICDALDSNPLQPQNQVWDSIDNIMEILDTTSLTQPAKQFLRYDELSRYGNALLNFSSFPVQLGIDLEKGNVGVMSREGARKFEQRQLIIFQPHAVRSARYDQPRALNRYHLWQQAYQETYGEDPFSDINLSTYFRDETQLREWKRGNEALQQLRRSPSSFYDAPMIQPAFEEVPPKLTAASLTTEQ